jgi:hypothetical protein
MAICGWWRWLLLSNEYDAVLNNKYGHCDSIMLKLLFSKLSILYNNVQNKGVVLIILVVVVILKLTFRIVDGVITNLKKKRNIIVQHPTVLFIPRLTHPTSSVVTDLHIV